MLVMKRLCMIAMAVVSIMSATAATFDFNAGRASLSPYPKKVAMVEYPDSLTPLFIDHVGRHGSRYPASESFTMMLKNALDKADSLKTITTLGKELKKEVATAITTTNGRWGQLDSLGDREQREIAARMFRKFPQLLDSATISALSSYSPRCIMSMYAFTNQLSMMASDIRINTSSGKLYNELMRNFDEDEEYLAFRNDTTYKAAYNRFAAANITIDPLLRILGNDYPLDYDKVYDLALAEYYVAAGMNAMGLKFDASNYFKLEEYRRLWAMFNFRQYLLYSASTLSTRPAEIAAPLLQNIIATADSVVSGKLKISAKLRFGHAETLMPLMSLMQAPGCYYLTNYFDTVADNWQDYRMFPMAANLQFELFKAPSGTVYVRVEYNEQPIRLLPSATGDFVKWDDLRLHLLERLPLS